MIRVLGARVVAKMPVRAERLKGSGLYIPECANEPPVEAVVMAVGNGVKGDIKVGDRVMFDQYSGLEEKDEDWGEILILMESELTAVIEGEEDVANKGGADVANKGEEDVATKVEESKNATL